ncbi:malto-oligosyltrehalose trehalohydrolase [Rufibacter radiotolerans]|uniref:Malto-oligosyltrehalose trehalohydrolase n=1 Tax=Rufibacter radiotolerans TaxID=1379910 RepID=A0A0H4VPJ5_9BACT|nr:malto-oligosyltrehalose trehalohydrolase [Rufibacter radiotolerans]AKQ45634.1 malto-oligosyltrehalose trehalohydrolase [Rufibacter radiotolerans]
MKKVGAVYAADGRCTFRVWDPLKESMVLKLVSPVEQQLEMQREAHGYFSLELANIDPGTRYFFMPNGEKAFPDPASSFQPEGVHGPSEVVDTGAYLWQDSTWRGLPFQDLVLYELHVGTFTPEGTFEAIIPLLPDLVETGINALELMPVAQFPGDRNWGYDGVYPYAVQDSYGGPLGLKTLVDACHALGIAVFLDVVFNHLGPEGNYLGNFGPFFTNKYKTPWGDALNFDGDWSDGVREYFAGNALFWFEEYHVDGLRLDAIHMVYDNGAVHFWEYTHQQVKLLGQKLGRPLYLTAESDLNSPKVVKDPEMGGYGFDAQWLDDFHHALYVLLDKKGKDRYKDFGKLEQLAKAYKDGFVHSGEYVTFRKRKHGVSSAGVSGEKFVAFNLNHDQVGNRVKGERLSVLVNLDRQKLAAAALLLAPYVPLLFMGEEYGDTAPFYYFISHSDKDLVKAVQQGRKEEFADFGFDIAPPDPVAEQTFQDSKLQWDKRTKGKHHLLLQWHQHLLHLRKQEPILRNFNKNDVLVNLLGNAGLVLHRQSIGGQEHLLCLFNFSEEKTAFNFPVWVENWEKILDSTETQWQEKKGKAVPLPSKVTAGSQMQLPALSVAVYKGQEEIE